MLNLSPVTRFLDRLKNSSFINKLKTKKRLPKNNKTDYSYLLNKILVDIEVLDYKGERNKIYIAGNFLLWLIFIVNVFLDIKNGSSFIRNYFYYCIIAGFFLLHGWQKAREKQSHVNDILNEKLTRTVNVKEKKQD